jgi:hypothetical protein
VKKAIFLFFGLILGACITGAVALLTLPAATKYSSFLAGFIASLGFVALCIASFLLIRKISGSRSPVQHWLLPLAFILGAIGRLG